MIIPYFLAHAISRVISKKQAKEIWDWLQSNSNTVIVDELMLAVRRRRDWTKEDER